MSTQYDNMDELAGLSVDEMNAAKRENILLKKALGLYISKDEPSVEVMMNKHNN